MLNEDLVRTPEGIRKVKTTEGRKAAAAMLYYVLEKSRGNRGGDVQRIIELMQRPRNRMGEYLDKVFPFLQGKTEYPPYECTNRDPLDYILAQVEAMNAEPDSAGEEIEREIEEL